MAFPRRPHPAPVPALVRQEVDVVTERLAGARYRPSGSSRMLKAGAQPLKDLIAALHTKLMVAELERRR